MLLCCFTRNETDGGKNKNLVTTEATYEDSRQIIHTCIEKINFGRHDMIRCRDNEETGRILDAESRVRVVLEFGDEQLRFN
jgi:hypothetical protein